MLLTVKTPHPFSFGSTVRSHGWCMLEPFSLAENPTVLSYSMTVDGIPADISITERDEGVLSVIVRHAGSVQTVNRSRIREAVRYMLRLDESYDELYRIAVKDQELRWIRKVAAGRMLRSATLYEDIIKMIATTNCSWALTTAMVGNICRALGNETPSGKRTFPGPEVLAAQTEKFIRSEIRAGYRAPYMLEVSQAIASGKVDPIDFLSDGYSAEELYLKLTELKGIGPYAAENLLKLIGHYDHLGLDSWSRKKYSQIHRKGRKVGDRTIVNHYRRFGKWSGLIFWLEMTREWYFEKFPLD